MSKVIGNTTATPNPRPDWAQSDKTKADYIKNKPGVASADAIGFVKSSEYTITETLIDTIDLTRPELHIWSIKPGVYYYIQGTKTSTGDWWDEPPKFGVTLFCGWNEEAMMYEDSRWFELPGVAPELPEEYASEGLWTIDDNVLYNAETYEVWTECELYEQTLAPAAPNTIRVDDTGIMTVSSITQDKVEGLENDLKDRVLYNELDVALDAKEDKTDAEALKKRVSNIEQVSLGNLYNYESATVKGSDTVPSNALNYAVLGNLSGSMKRVTELGIEYPDDDARYLANVNYSSEYVDVETYTDINGIIYSPTANERTGKFLSDDTGLLCWEASGDGPYINMNGAAIANAENNVISVIVDISNVKMASAFRFLDADSNTLTIFTTNASGQVILPVINSVLTTDGRLCFTVDFNNGVITYFTSDGQTNTTSFTCKNSKYSSTQAWKQAFTGRIFSFRAGGAGSMNIGGIYMYDGDIFTVSKRFETSDSAYIQVGNNNVIIPEEVRALPGYGCLCPSYMEGYMMWAQQPSKIRFSTKKYTCEAVKLILTGEEDMIFEGGNTVIQNVLVDDCKKSQCWITHGNVRNQVGLVNTVYAGNARGNKHLYISDLNATFDLNTLEEFQVFLRKEYAEGNPVTVIYKFDKEYDISEYINDEFIKVLPDKEISIRRDDGTIDPDAELTLTYRVKI